MATNIKKEVKRYLNLPWTYILRKEKEKNHSFYIISIDELPGICSDGNTIGEAMTAITEALSAAIELSLELGKKIPLPINKSKFKGNVAYRTTPSRHYKLALEAKRRHLSLSKMLDSVVDTAIN